MVDERGRAEPQLGAVLAGGIHDAEIVLAVAQQQVLLALRQLGDAPHQVLDLVVSFPGTQKDTVSDRDRTHRPRWRPRTWTKLTHQAFVATILAPFCSEE